MTMILFFSIIDWYEDLDETAGGKNSSEETADDGEFLMELLYLMRLKSGNVQVWTEMKVERRKHKVGIDSGSEGGM